MNQSIKAKLFGGFSFIVLLLITVAFFMTNKLSETNNRLDNLITVSAKNVSLSHEILINVLNATKQEKDMILERDITKKNFYLNKMNITLSSIDKKIPELYELVDEKGAADVNEFKTLWNEYKISLDEIIELAMKNETDNAFEISGTEGYKTREEVTAIMERIIDRNEKRMADDKIISDENYQSSLNLIVILIITGLILLIAIAYWIIQGITNRISFIAKEAEKIASREFSNDKLEDKTKDELKPIFNALININESFREVTENANKVASGDNAVDLTPRSDKDILGIALKKMTRSLRETTTANEKYNWLTAGQNQLNKNLMGDQSLEELTNNTISFLCTYLRASIGAVYLFNDKENALVLSGQYAFLSPKDIKEKFMMSEGLIGQAAHEQKQISLTDVRDEQIRITSSVLNVKPKHLLITPFLFKGKTMGVIEIGRLTDFNETEKEFITISLDNIAISVNTIVAKENIEKLLIRIQEKEQELNNQIKAIDKSNASIEFDLNGTILSANENFLHLMGYTENEIVGKHHSILVEKSYAATKEYRQFWDSLKKGEFKQDEFKRIQKNGEPVWLVGSYNPILDASGKPIKILEIATDITLARKQEQELAQQYEELQTQQEELKQMNEELEEQAQNLKQQQEELQMTNEELEEQTQSLEIKNSEVQAAKNDIEQKTKQLEISSKYKSEFLANMSHELRTPLNSLLILSKDLSENKKKNLDNIQVESAEIIYKSGHDLLVLINEVLDLSKIEAGKMSITIEKVFLRSFTEDLIRDFKHLAEQKRLKLTCTLDKKLPEFIRTDSQRLNQILKNLISNAIKFTAKGSVTISINKYSGSSAIITVTDTGIGIQENKQTAIFEAFQQADGGTARKYGGTGLGLSISRELAKLLGAEIKLESKINKGSSFSIIIPIEIHYENDPVKTSITRETIAHKAHIEIDSKYLDYPSIADDRNSITMDDKIVLVIEDDLKFASILLKQANKKGFKCLSAATGEDGLLLAAKYKPQAIILDMALPGINGHEVLHELKTNPSIRHLPVHIISVNERTLEPVKEGAIEYLLKPIDKKGLEGTFDRIENFISRKIKNLLIIEDNENSRKAMRILIGNGDVKCLEAGSGKEALAIYEQNQIDCIILDIGLTDMSGFDLIHKLENIKDHNIPPIIVYTGKELTKEENNELQKYAESIIIKGVKSEERLLDETALFLHRTISNLPKSKQLIINNLHDKEAAFQSKKILLVDDDSRNVFALSQILQERGMEIIKAENGKVALEMLDTYPDIDLVLMDIMMPEMDGYEAMRRIRSQEKFKSLPIISLTAKAMKDDKQKCIDAGANDYIAKPIDAERLLSLMRVWLSK